MFRKDAYSHYQIVFAALLALAAVGKGPAAWADAMHIDTAVRVTYAPPAGSAPQTVTSNTASVVVSQTAGVLLSPVLGSQRVATATPTAYSVAIRNTGTGTDTFTLSVARTAGWGAALLNADRTQAPATVTLAAGASQTFLLTLTPPASATHACSGMAVLKAVSAMSPAVYGQAAALTNCAAASQAGAVRWTGAGVVRRSGVSRLISAR